MSGTVPGPEFPPPDDARGQPSFHYPAPVAANAPPPPPRVRADTTVRNLLIAVLVAVCTVVPLTGFWVISAVNAHATEDSADRGTSGKGMRPPPPTEPSADDPAAAPPAAASGAPADTQPPPPEVSPPAAQGQQRGGGVCCCDGSQPQKKKGGCRQHGGRCPCQGQGGR